MSELIYGFTLEEWNSFSEEEQIDIQNKYEYLLFLDMPPDGR